MACALLLAWLWPSSGSASPPASRSSALTSETLRGATQSVRRYKVDARGRPAYLARFSDGPRHVPESRGAAKVRADRLSIGTADAARKLLRSRPSALLLREVSGKQPKELLWPVVHGHFGRGFGMTRRVRTEVPHNGVDIGAPEGAVVRAAADGLVVYSDNGLLGYGNCVMILHPGGMLTLYAHNQQTTVQAGWAVKRGERIALVGKTGYAWGPHLHFELRDNGRLRDPVRKFVGQRSDEVTGELVELEPPLPAQRILAVGARRRIATPR
jgi:murein DD-endopeptidase MepM/ murein hydrolase activator NlpD